MLDPHLHILQHDITLEKLATIVLWVSQSLVGPARIQPNSISSAVGEPTCPVRRPCNITLWTHIFPITDQFAVTPHSQGQPRWDHSDNFNELENEQVVRGVGNCLYIELLIDIVNRSHLEGSQRLGWRIFSHPSDTEIVAINLERRSDKVCANRSVMNDTDEPESNKALACMTPCGESTRTWQVIGRVCPPFITECDGMAFTGVWVGPGIMVGVVVGVVSGSTCSKLWCWPWHSLHLLRDLHCLRKWPGQRQFRQRLLLFTKDVAWLWLCYCVYAYLFI